MAHYRLNSKSREEWLENRKDGIGASEVGTILGLSQYDTPYQLWLRKTGQVETKQEENLLMQLGHLLETPVATIWSEQTRREVIANSAGDWQFVSVERPFLRVSPDRLYWLPGEKKNAKNRGILEIKTTQKGVSEDDFPKGWFCQLQMNLGVAELEYGSLAWLISGRDFGYRDFTFDRDFFDWMVEEVTRFWVDCVLGGKEPALANVRDLLIKFPKSVAGKAVDATTEIYEKWENLREVNAEIRRLQAVKDEAEEAIKMALGDAESLVSPSDAKVLATWKSGKKDRESFNEKLFAAEHPDLYAQYIVTSPASRRFACKD